MERAEMIQKHELPILEYDSNSEEVIRPNHGAEQLNLPEKCVYAFLGEAVDDYAFEAEATVAETFETITRNYPVYIVKQDGMEFCLCAAPLGAPAAAQLMDFLISCGCKKIISAGSCGVLTDLAENEFLIPVKALRDEGTSYHYLPASRYIELNKNIRDAIEHTLLVQNIPFRECVTWTTDGFFRETQDMVRYRGAEGCTTVEMECAANDLKVRLPWTMRHQKRATNFGWWLFFGAFAFVSPCVENWKLEPRRRRNFEQKITQKAGYHHGDGILPFCMIERVLRGNFMLPPPQRSIPP